MLTYLPWLDLGGLKYDISKQGERNHLLPMLRPACGETCDSISTPVAGVGVATVNHSALG